LVLGTALAERVAFARGVPDDVAAMAAAIRAAAGLPDRLARDLETGGAG
jgi:hypothetical protein